MPAGSSPPARRRRRSRKEGPPTPSPLPPSHKPNPLPPGTEIEVRIDDEGFYGSWYEATVVGFDPATGRRSPAKYTVAYSHLEAQYAPDSVAPSHVLPRPPPPSGPGSPSSTPAPPRLLLHDFADAFGCNVAPAPSHVRPRPPHPPGPGSPSSTTALPRFLLHDFVEVFDRSGWWSGIVVAPAPADPGSPVTVAFLITREVLPFPAHLVRPHRDYIGGEWAPSLSVIAVQPRRAVRVYKAGENVELLREREAYGNS
ncbi:vegetative cell wall protein gp1-like [Panicum virgatum]|uniref:vegetative cell wall protein gp1-like n=1 Tax=Panicum virgatum TaxID=38727 RepID=UPI0002A9B086|nr:vegetative cell wall protein gp1-like [Panicum virgatum]